MTPGQEPVQGFVLTTAAHILAILDEYEQHDPDELQRYQPDLLADQNQYDRQQIETYDLNGNPLGLAWAYLMAREQVQRLKGVLLPDGIWISHP